MAILNATFPHDRLDREQRSLIADAGHGHRMIGVAGPSSGEPIAEPFALGRNAQPDFQRAPQQFAVDVTHFTGNQRRSGILLSEPVALISKLGSRADSACRSTHTQGTVAMAIYPSSAACSSERAHDPGSAMKKGTATAFRLCMSESLVSRVLARVSAGSGESYRVAGMIKFDIGYFYLGIPLWLTFVSTYLVLTDARLVLADRTLWRGLVSVVDIPFDEIYCLVLNDQKKKVYIRLRSGNMIDFAVSTPAFLKAIVNAVDGQVNVQTQA